MYVWSHFCALAQHSVTLTMRHGPATADEEMSIQLSSQVPIPTTPLLGTGHPQRTQATRMSPHAVSLSPVSVSRVSLTPPQLAQSQVLETKVTRQPIPAESSIGSDAGNVDPSRPLSEVLRSSALSHPATRGAAWGSSRLLRASGPYQKSYA